MKIKSVEHIIQDEKKERRKSYSKSEKDRGGRGGGQLDEQQ